MIESCCDILLPDFNIDCCKPIPNMNIQNLVFIKMSDCIKDDNGNFVRMKRKYGKFTRPIFKTKEELIVNL